MLPDFSHETDVHNSLLTVALDNETFSAPEKYVQCIINRRPETGLLSNLLRYISNFFRKVRYLPCHILFGEITTATGNFAYKKTYFNLSYTSYDS